MPRVSIIIPCYNIEDCVEVSIRSAINQTLRDIEIIIVNDGSTDNTKCKIENLIKKDTRIRLINKTNGGLSSARNRGIESARGEYIQHLDGGDWLCIDACEQAYKKAKEKQLDIVMYDIYRKFENGHCDKWDNFNWNEDKIYTGQEALDSYFSSENYCFVVWNKLIKRELYQEIRHPEHISLGEDIATMPKLLAISKNIGKINQPYIYYIYSEESISHKDLGEKHIQLFWAFKEIEEFFKKQNIYKNNQQQIERLKIDQLTQFIYRKPSESNENYRLAAKEFLKLIQQQNLESLPLKRRIYCYIQRWCHTERELIFNIKVLQLCIKILGIGIEIL